MIKVFNLVSGEMTTKKKKNHPQKPLPFFVGEKKTKQKPQKPTFSLDNACFQKIPHSKKILSWREMAYIHTHQVVLTDERRHLWTCLLPEPEDGIWCCPWSSEESNNCRTCRLSSTTTSVAKDRVSRVPLVILLSLGRGGVWDPFPRESTMEKGSSHCNNKEGQKQPDNQTQKHSLEKV